MKTYPSYEILAIDLDLHFFDKAKVLNQSGKRLEDGSWVVVTDDGCCHLFDKRGNLDDINKLNALKEHYIRRDIKKIIIPDSVTSIESYAFGECTSLKSIAIPYSVTRIEIGTFMDCYNLKSVTIPNTVTSIGHGAFKNCSSLADIVIPNSVTSIGDYVFEDCSILKNVTISESVTNIGPRAFDNCSSLTSVVIPNSVKSIGYWAFRGCKNLKSVFFKGKTLEQVKDMAFYPWGIKNENIIKAEFE